MSDRRARHTAQGVVTLSLAILAAGFVTEAASGAGLLVGPQDVLLVTMFVVFSAVGFLIATRHPGNPIGWLFLGVALAHTLGGLAHGYADYWLAGKGAPRALGQTAAWYESSSWIPWVLIPATFLLLLFPDGHLPTRRWRPIAWCGAVGIPLAFVTSGAHSGPLEDFPEVANPYTISGPLLSPLEGIAMLLVLVAIVGSALSLIVRFRRAPSVQRQQIKWLALAGAIAAVTVVVGTAGYDWWGEAVSNIAIELSLVGLPVAAGVAILRYRLYDVDVVINRTLVYGLLTATLAVAYLCGVLVLGLALRPLTKDSNLAIAGSTLAVAALFRPARARIQQAVDRRFYRRRYDAQRTLEAFSARLRNEVDLDALGGELRLVARETMQPVHVSLWLPEARP